MRSLIFHVSVKEGEIHMRTGRKKHMLLFLAAMVLSLLLPVMAGAEEVCSHEWSDWEIWEMPDCTKPGKSTRYCRKCNQWESEEIPAKGDSQRLS